MSVSSTEAVAAPAAAPLATNLVASAVADGAVCTPTAIGRGSKKRLKIDLHSHILPRSWPDLKKKFGYGGWVQLEHGKNGSANMTVDGKFFRAIEKNAYDPGEHQCLRRRCCVVLI